MATSRAERLDRSGNLANELWWVFLLQGLVAVFFGIASIFWPGLTLVALVYLFSAFVLVWSIVEIIHGFLAIRRGGTWWLPLLFGLIGLGVGVYLVRHPEVSFTTLILIMGLLLIGRGLLDVVDALMRRHTRHRILSFIVGAAAILAGILLFLQPREAGVAFVWILGLYALIYGTLTIALAFEVRELADDETRS